MSIRNRIKGHRRVRAGDLVPHEYNWRVHPERQRQALRDLYQEVGFARSLLAFELPDGRLKLIDGHLRRELDPDLVMDVEVLDVSEDEARKLLLSIDSLAALAEADTGTVARLNEVTRADSQTLAELWHALELNEAEVKAALEAAGRAPAEQFLILVECRDESHQVELLDQFQRQGIPCRALVG